MKMKQAGFTLIEIMIVVAIIIVLAAVATPNLINARNNARKAACIANLQMLDGVITSWSLEYQVKNGTAVNVDQILPLLKGKHLPVCPGGGTYTFGKVGDEVPVHCDIEDHIVP